MTLRDSVKLGLIGWPAAHSLSPRVFSALGRLLGRGLSYELLEVKPGGLGPALERLRREGYAGLNVTIPHKQAVIPFLTGLTREARGVGAVNALRATSRGWRGHNTDAAGFTDALAEMGLRVRGSRALVFGAGGAARAVGYALGRGGAASVHFAARRKGEALGLAESLRKIFHETDFRCGLAAAAEIVINATPLGMKGFPERSPARRLPAGGGFASDLVYSRDTPFLKQARAAGLKAVDGLGMLVFQALRSWEFWHGPLSTRRRREFHNEILGNLV